MILIWRETQDRKERGEVSTSQLSALNSEELYESCILVLGLGPKAPFLELCL